MNTPPKLDAKQQPANKQAHNSNLRSESASQRSITIQAFADERAQTASQDLQIQQMQAATQSANNTGLPDKLKSGMETLSGYSLDDVKVHYNSDKPAQLQAHAYAQGADIHLAPGQEKHLPHEAWHVIQQKQGRVKPTRQMKGRIHINDDSGLEKEADIMGAKALHIATQIAPQPTNESGDKRSGVAAIQSKSVVQAVISPEQQQVVDNGNVHRTNYQFPAEQIEQLKALYQQWGKTVPTLQQFQEATHTYFALRSSDPALTQIDQLLAKYNGTNDPDEQVVWVNHLLLACNFWLRKVNQVKQGKLPLDFTNRGNLPNNGKKLEGKESRRLGIITLQHSLTSYLTQHDKPNSLSKVVNSMARENRGLSALHQEVDIHNWDNRHNQRLPHTTSTQHERGVFGDTDPDGRLFSLDNDSQKRLAKLVFRSGKAYRWQDFLKNSGFALFNTSNGGVHYTMDKRGRIYAGTFTDGPYFVHSSLVGFSDVLSAGFIVVKDGKVTKIKNDSGHYHPRAQEMVNMLLRLQLYGVNLADVTVERLNGTHHKGAKEFTANEMLSAAPGEWPDEWEGLQPLL
ncbi:eCIS core domain-containing protein [Pseudoalteromonas sp. S16_S37]|uniref:eCIS core domain-containing protein n=1 Tax=Pseudoalteromonas sp. S16_S37 TaxID=2720228 RepID=UPI0016818087|nr:DUF4157 domain-containing protein [Pseudoalteromonas sp. S16_S37]MBD1580860.1 DUF4157 domain-containing protein [Pseudoalteromonas sp. S16_S37]